jgi:hypothetical protein
MSTQMIDRTEEKIKLAKAVGLKTWAKMREEVKSLTSLKFKSITLKEIEDKICNKRVFFSNELLLQSPIIILAIPITVAVFCASPTAYGPIALLTPTLLFVLCVFGFCAFRCFHKYYLELVDLNDWTDDMPYGAFLALKEAKEAGLGNFVIYYPSTGITRVKADPVIVGYLKNNKTMLEVFAWDDGKVYE